MKCSTRFALISSKTKSSSVKALRKFLNAEMTLKRGLRKLNKQSKTYKNVSNTKKK